MPTVRNKRTGEFRDVTEAELVELQKEVTSDGFPAWEQTSYAHATDVKEKATYGELLENHYGEDIKAILKHEALVRDASGVGPESNPHLELTPGEIGEGLTREDKLEQLRTEYAPSVPTRQKLEGEAHEAISGESVKTRSGQERQKSRGQRSRAGGTEPSNPPAPDPANTDPVDPPADPPADPAEGDGAEPETF